MFIELTKLTYGSVSGHPSVQSIWETPVTVNTKKIASVEVQEDCSVINFVGMSSITVKETIELKGKLID